jgi:hypothetical protein
MQNHVSPLRNPYGLVICTGYKMENEYKRLIKRIINHLKIFELPFHFGFVGFQAFS